MAKEKNHLNFENLTFDDFRRLAKNPLLSRHEKVGFPNSYRDGKENDIFRDMLIKVSNLSLPKKNILEIGPGCSALPFMLSNLCEKNKSKLFFVDSKEMLELLPKGKSITKFAGKFPAALGDKFERYIGKIDAVLAYSVIQYVFMEDNLWDFVDKCLLLLADGGEILLGDIPNISMRKRFFASNAGLISHQHFTQSDEKPIVSLNQLELGHMDDSVVVSILSRARAQGFHAWVVPQLTSLPMANRREDILIRKP